MADNTETDDDDDVIKLTADIGKAVRDGDVKKVNELTKEAKRRGLY